jgi:hypothetical protein
MKIKINGQTYDVPREYEARLFEQLWQMAQDEYGKLAKEWRVLAMPFTRGGLKLLENKVARSEGKEAAKALRPGANDPNLFLAQILAKMLFEGMKYVTLACEVESESIVAFHLDIEPSESPSRR